MLRTISLRPRRLRSCLHFDMQAQAAQQCMQRLAHLRLLGTSIMRRSRLSRQCCRAVLRRQPDWR